MLSAMTVQILAIMYILLFASVIRLRYKEPNTPRPYKIPGGKQGIWFVGGAGGIACLFTFVIGFVPPTGLTTQGPLQYVLTMVGGTVLLSLPPFIFYRFRKSGWRASKAEMKAALSTTT
jgi:amino acid transporter